MTRSGSCAAATSTSTAANLLGLEDVPLAEEFVFQAEQFAPVDVEVAAAHEAERLATGGAVEGFGDRGSPVHHHRVAVLVGHCEAADVERLGTVETARSVAGGAFGLVGGEVELRPNTRAASPRSSWVSRLNTASSNTSRS